MISRIIDEKNRILAAILLIFVGALGRLTLSNFLPQTPEIYLTVNGITQPLFMMDLFFIVAIISLLSGLLLGSYYTFIVPISVMIITDILLGNNWILFFTWSGFGLIAILGWMLKRKKQITIRKIPSILGVGILGILIYDLWTNFGCFLGWYPHTFSGLATCYTVAFPFMMWHLLSTTITLTLILVPVLFLKEHGFLNIKFTRKPIKDPNIATIPEL